MEFSDFPSDLALHALQCGMMLRLRDNARSSLDVWPIFQDLSKTKFQSNLKI